MITLIIVVALALAVGIGFAVKHFMSAAQIASVEAVLKNGVVAEVKTVITDVRTPLGL